LETVVLAPAGYLLDPAIGSDYERPWRLVEGLAKRDLRVVVVARDVRQLERLGRNVELARPPGRAPASPLGRIVDRVNLYAYARRVVNKEIASGNVLAVHHLGPCGEQSPSLVGPLTVPFVYGPLPGPRPVMVADDEWLSWLLTAKASRLQAKMSMLAAAPTRPLARALWRRTVRRADAVTVEASVNAPPGFREVVTIPPGIDASQFSPIAGADRVPGRVITAGRLIARKGYDILIRAMRDLVREYRPAHLLIVGTGPEELSLKLLVASLDLASSVTFAGDVSRASLPDLLRSADVFCHPAVWDNVPFAVLEAMACGLPVTVSSAGGLPEMVGDAGLVHPVGIEKSLTAQLLDLLTHPILRKSLGIAARARVTEFFTWDRMCDAYLDLYTELASSKPRAAIGS
jgi:glycosyltransferase involved in cell wall biosynthesis